MTEPIEGHRLDVGQELGQTLDNLVKQGALLVTLPAFDHQRGLADPPCLGGIEAPLVDGLDLVGEKEGRFADGPS